MEPENKTKKLRGFAALSPEKRLELARKGGAAVKREDRTFSKNKGTASKAGMKGGASVRPENRSFSRDPEKAKEAGRKGGKMAMANRKAKENEQN